MTAETIQYEPDSSPEDIVNKAADILLSGGVIVYPTDTSYGIACDPRIEAAADRLIEIKRRDPNLGLPLLFSGFSQCESYHDFGELERILTKLFWPGALTLVVKAKTDIPATVTGRRDSIAVRVPDHIVPRGIAAKIDGPIVGTSANRHGGPSPFSIAIAQEQLGDEVDLYIDAGTSDASKNSTIIGVELGTPANIKVYREGELSIERLTESLRVDGDALQFWTNRIVYADM
ncbi:threonylcarbamoyl-AMP synthase [Candidatus Thorarchaeota archaeon]|nr:MAG: threonylcarbamoyl-AMP synthase [Candidatus Thorarchaeota archaeon]